MPELEAGDLIVIDTASTVYTYRLTTGGADLQVPSTSGWVLDESPTNPDPDGPTPDPGSDRLITLITCPALFDTDSRLVAFGVLESSKPR
jgi:sortase A